MNKDFDFDKTFKSILNKAIKNFVWIVVVGSVLIILAERFLGDVEMRIDVKNIAMNTLLAAVLSFTIYFSFWNYGEASGLDTREYGETFYVYKRAINGRLREDIDAFLNYAKAASRKAFEEAAALAAGVKDKAALLEIPKKYTRVTSSRYNYGAKKAIRMVQNSKYPNNYPKSAAHVFNFDRSLKKSAHGVNPDALAIFRAKKTAAKVVKTALFIFFSGTLFVQYAQIDVPTAILQVSLVLASFAMSLFGGYQTGYKAALLNKEVLSATINVLEEMDTWAAANGVKISCTVEQAKRVEAEA
jgi:hypothetical protein